MKDRLQSVISGLSDRSATLQNFDPFCLSCRGVDLSKWRELLDLQGEPADMLKFTAQMESHSLPNSVIIDCTASAKVAEMYYQWVKKGIHMITPNKKANSGPYEQVLVKFSAIYHFSRLRYQL